MKICYVCEYCGEQISCQEGVSRPESGNWPEDPIISHTPNHAPNTDITTDVIMVKTICDDCLAALGRTDDGISSWISGINVFRH